MNLKWNQISCRGAIPILEGLHHAANVKNLNLSYNNLSRHESLDMIVLLTKVINEKLVHLDLSNNNMSSIACAKLGEMIVNNHTLYGLHMHGNN